MDKKDHPKNWRNILWREWRNTDDEEYASHLFELVTHKSAMDWQVTSVIIGLGILFGAGLGLLIAFITLFRTIGLDLNEWTANLNSIGSFLAVGSLIGGGMGLLMRANMQRSFIWPEIFFRLWLSGAIGLIYWLIAGPLVGFVAVSIANLALIFLTPEGNDFADGIILFFITFFIVTIIFVPILGITGFAIGLIAACLILFGTKVNFWGLDDILIKLKSAAAQYEGKTIPLIQQIFQHKRRSWYFWWHGQPKLVEVKEALEQSLQTLVEYRKYWTGPLQLSAQSKKRLDTLKLYLSNLQSDNWSYRFGAAYALSELGGEAVSSLCTIAENNKWQSQQTAIRILKDIAWDTSNRLAERATNLVCPQCLVRCHVHKINFPWQPAITFYGCRTCEQSREFLECPQGIVAVLDAGWTETHRLKNGLLQVNWSAQQRLFDFDRVEIIQATDEDVERFVIQVGNDTDPVRQLRYAQMPPLIAPECRLSENSLRILRNFLGQVERQEIVQVSSAIVEDAELAPAENMADEETDVYWQNAD